MTAATLPLPHSRVDSALSSEAGSLRDRLREIGDSNLTSLSLGARYTAADRELVKLYEDAASENWDGYGAQPVAPVTLAWARALLWALPTTVPMPDFVAEPDGEIAFEWHTAKRWLLSVSVSPSGELSYAGLFGRHNAHGTEQLVDEVPREILNNLGRYLQEVPPS